MNRYDLNLAKVAIFLASNSEQVASLFTMETTGDVQREGYAHDNYCGTPGCVIGWAPIALCLPKSPWRYAINPRDVFDRDYDPAGPLFGAEWRLVDDTALGAAARILHVLELESQGWDLQEFEFHIAGRSSESQVELGFLQPLGEEFESCLDTDSGPLGDYEFDTEGAHIFQAEANVAFPELLEKYRQIVSGEAV